MGSPIAIRHARVFPPATGILVVSVGAALAAGCAVLQPAPPLFPSGRPVVTLDFEETPINQLPDKLSAPADGRWAVVDSPQAVSGSQVVVRHGDGSSGLGLSEMADRVVGEVAVRVIVGPRGAGLACETSDSEGYLFQAEPGQRRVALYRRGDGATELIAAETAAVKKGEWAWVGFRCEPNLIVGYLDGRAVLRQALPVGRSRLALWADGGVVAQFDDLRYSLTDGRN